MNQIVPGKLIVIDGTDGSGKTTQTTLLIQRMKQYRIPCETLEFPQYGKTFFGDMVARYLNGEFGGHDEISPYLASVLYAADRWQAKDTLRSWLADGKHVILNRYVSANQGHQGGKIPDPDERARFMQWLDRLEFEVFGIPRPDRVILLHIAPEIAQALVDKKGHREYVRGVKRDIHESSIEHLRNAESAYCRLAEQNDNWVRIECAPEGRLLSEQQIAKMVWKEVEEIVKIRGS
ncbi:MAG: thymidylate kinase [Planctomycetota bacterium]